MPRNNQRDEGEWVFIPATDQPWTHEHTKRLARALEKVLEHAARKRGLTLDEYLDHRSKEIEKREADDAQ